MSEKLRWGIIGTGHIAAEFADGVKESDLGVLVAVASRTQDSVERFGQKHGITKRYAPYEAMLEDPGVQAVYISTPHPMHAEWAIRCAEAGKHVLCEKPIGINRSEAAAMIAAAREHDVFLMEAFMYRCHPYMARLRELIVSGEIGEVRMIRASFSYGCSAGPESRCFAQELGGGGILDVGCYPASMSRFVAGAATGQLFAEPTAVKGVAHLGPTGVDHYAAAIAMFPNGIVAELATGVGLPFGRSNTVDVFGSKGYLHIPDPWTPSRWNRDPVRIVLRRYDEKEDRTIQVDAPKDLYSYEADTVAAHIEARQADAMRWDDTLGNVALLDRWRAEVGLVYDMEKPERATRTITGRPLKVRASHPIPSLKLPGMPKPISRLIIGAANNNTMPDTSILFDDYFEHGGTTFDTSHGYGNPNGACERNLGTWIRQRGIRDRVVVIEKGANHPNDTPAGLTKELRAGLERLQLDFVDLYMIHRDNEQVPIGEWVEALNENLRAGRMKAFGLSNFSIARLDAFATYAHGKGLATFSAVSNQCSLARVLAPIWNMHLVSSGDPASRAWFERTQTPLLAWSSQARGFFTDRAAPGSHTDADLVRCWYSEENFERKRRAEKLARRKGVEAINVAVAWVLAQPFPTCAMIGPLNVLEFRSSLGVLAVELSAEDVRWLDLQ